MFTVNSCRSNQDQLDLALVVQKNTKGYTKMHFTSFHLTASLLSTPKCEKAITSTTVPKMNWSHSFDDRHTHTHTNTHRNTHTKTYTTSAVLMTVLKIYTTSAVLMTIFKDSHHFSRTLGDVWWQSFTTSITSIELWAMFDDNLSRHPSLQ